MAREVNTVLAKIISEQRGIPESKGEDVVKSMRSANQYQVRHLMPCRFGILEFHLPMRHKYSPYSKQILMYLSTTGGCMVMIEQTSLFRVHFGVLEGAASKTDQIFHGMVIIQPLPPLFPFSVSLCLHRSSRIMAELGALSRSSLLRMISCTSVFHGLVNTGWFETAFDLAVYDD